MPTENVTLLNNELHTAQ